MGIRNKVTLITLIFAVPAFLTGKMIWPPNPIDPVPTTAQLPFFIILSVFESVAFGLGVAFLVLGWPMIQKLTGKSKPLTTLVFLSIDWYLINWWPHDNLHSHNGMDLQGLLYIEYGFHATMMIAGAILAYFFITNFSKFSKS